MEKHMDEIQIEVHFCQRQSVATSTLTTVLRSIESAIIETEKQEIEVLSDKIKDIPVVAIDACYERLRKYNGFAYRLSATRSGSVVVVGLVAGVAYYVLDKTLGETLKEAWLESKMHEKIKNLLTDRRNVRAHKISDLIHKKLKRRMPIDYISQGVGTRDLIMITIQLKPDPKDELGAELDKSNEYRKNAEQHNGGGCEK